MTTEHTRTAVVVDDDEQIRQILHRLLSSAGVTVVAEFSSGEDAVEWMTADRADFVIMDIQMPGMGGIEATRLISSNHPEIRVFGFTAWGDAEAEAMLRAGATAVFEKTKLPDLLEALRGSS